MWKRILALLNRSVYLQKPIQSIPMLFYQELQSVRIIEEVLVFLLHFLKRLIVLVDGQQVLGDFEVIFEAIIVINISDFFKGAEDGLLLLQKFFS